MYVTSQTIIEVAAIITAIMTIGGVIVAAAKWFFKQHKQDEDIAEIKENMSEIKSEQYVMNRVLLACLDGLMELGCDGNVTKAHDELGEHLNRMAHQ